VRSFGARRATTGRRLRAGSLFELAQGAENDRPQGCGDDRTCAQHRHPNQRVRPNAKTTRARQPASAPRPTAARGGDVQPPAITTAPSHHAMEKLVAARPRATASGSAIAIRRAEQVAFPRLAIRPEADAARGLKQGLQAGD